METEPKPKTQCAKQGCHRPKLPGSAFCAEHSADPDNRTFTCDNLPAVQPSNCNCKDR